MPRTIIYTFLKVEKKPPHTHTKNQKLKTKQTLKTECHQNILLKKYY